MGEGVPEAMALELGKAWDYVRSHSETSRETANRRLLLVNLEFELPIFFGDRHVIHLTTTTLNYAPTASMFH